MKSLRQHSLASGEPELLSMRGHQSDIVSLFEDILLGGTDLRVRVTGRSMKPLLKGGEILTIRRVTHALLRKGDLILFNSQDSLVLHRIIKRSYADQGTLIFQTQGDAMQSADGPVPQEKVLGKVLKIEKNLSGGRLKQWNMESAYWQVLNASIAGTSPIRKLMRYTHSGFFRHIPALTNKFIGMVSLSRSADTYGPPSKMRKRN